MSFASMNAFNASKGMSGTQRATSATFNPAQSQPLQAAPQGMSGGESVPPIGSSYTAQGGMMGTGRQRTVIDMPNAQGVVAGRPQQANVGQPPPQLTAAQMQDPANAAMAGFQFAGTQDQAPSASTNPGARPPPELPATNMGMKQFATSPQFRTM